MSRYQVLRRVGCGPFTAGVIAFMNWLTGQRVGVIRFMHIEMEYDPQGAADHGR